VSDIVHCAASVSFSLPLDRSREINVDGTRQMLDFGVECESRGGLGHFAYVSTAYVAGTHEGVFNEDDLNVGQDFRNPYERSSRLARRPPTLPPAPEQPPPQEQESTFSFVYTSD
jgi:nucleoside-diphosphate-sugar epimerase